MKFISRTATAAALITAVCVATAQAGQVRLQIKDGLVTLQAVDATPREILAEWARVGQTRIVNAERVPGGTITLELNGVPERQALDIILRTSPGFMAAPRSALVANASVYDRILVMPGIRQAAGVAAPAPNTPAGRSGMGNSNNPYGGLGRFGNQGTQGNQGNQGMMGDPGGMPNQPALMVDDQDQPVVQPAPMPVNPTPGTAAQPGMATQSPYPPQPSPYGNPYPNPYTVQQPGMQQPGAQTPGSTTQPPYTVRPGMPTAPQKPPGGPGGN